MRGHSLNIHAERGGTPAEALRADAEGVYPLQQLPLHRGVVFIGVRLIYRTQQRVLCKLRDLIKAAADTYASIIGGQGVRPGELHGLDDEVLDALPRRPQAWSILRRLMFSLPKPLGATVSFTLSPVQGQRL